MIGAHGAAQGVRERLVAAATRQFAERGFDATPIQAIADEVGITKPALLHHFPSKEHLRQEVLSSILNHWSEKLPRLLLAATEGGVVLANAHGSGVLEDGGMTIFRAADLTEARKIATDDPTVQSGMLDVEVKMFWVPFHE